MLDANVLEIDRRFSNCREQPGKLARTVDEHDSHSRVRGRLCSVLSRDTSAPIRPSLEFLRDNVEFAHLPTGNRPKRVGRPLKAGNNTVEDVSHRLRIHAEDVGPQRAIGARDTGHVTKALARHRHVSWISVDKLGSEDARQHLRGVGDESDSTVVLRCGHLDGIRTTRGRQPIPCALVLGGGDVCRGKDPPSVIEEICSRRCCARDLSPGHGMSSDESDWIGTQCACVRQDLCLHRCHIGDRGVRKCP